MFCRSFHFVLVGWLWLTALAAPASDGWPALEPTTISEPPYRFRRWTSEDQLPQNTVVFLAQTPDGYLWAGTKNGLARFDGVRFTVFTHELLREDRDAACRDLEVDGEGCLWVRLQDSLVRYNDGRFETFSLKSRPAEMILQTMMASRKGGVWIGTWGHGLQRFQNGKLTQALRTRDGLATDYVGLLREDAQGRVWIRTEHRSSRAIQAWQRLDETKGELKSLSEIVGRASTNVWTILPDRRGRLWGTVPGGLICWAEGKLICYDASSVWSNESPGEMEEDNNGALYFAPAKAAKVVRFENGRFALFDLERQMIDRDLRRVHADQEGNIWVGSGAQGLLQLQPGLMHSQFTTNANGKRQEIHSVATGAGGAIWLTTGSRLLQLRDEVVKQFRTESDGGELTHIQSAIEDRSGQVWVKAAGGLFKLNGDRLVSVPAADLGRRDWNVTVLHEDRRGRLWIGTDTGLLELRDGQFNLHTARDGLLDENICGIRDAPDGSLWFGTKRGGLHRLLEGQIENYTTTNGLLSNRVWPLRTEADGTVWVGTPSGLNRIRNGEVRVVTATHGLFDNEIYSLLADDLGNFWAHCNRGIFRMGQSELNAVADGRAQSLRCVSYGEADGIASTEGNGDYQPNAARLPDGRMWFPTTCGVVVFAPGEVLQNDIAPSIVIEEVEADDEVIYGSALNNSPSDGRSPTLSLAPGRGRWLKIHFTANSFLNPRRVHFQYRLVGHDHDWRNVMDERVAYYADLRPGRYRFQVKASNPHGVWNDSPASFDLFLKPHFYQRRLFYVLCGVSVALAGLGLHYRRMQGLRRLQHLEQQRALLDERARIARDLHDDLGANLTGIALKADLAQRQADGTHTAGQFAEIAASTRVLVDQMRETVWALNPKNDTLERLAHFLAQQAEDFVTGAGLRCRLELPDSFPHITVLSPARYHIYLAVKEALHNAIKHAGAREVHFSLNLQGNDLCLCISDDGHGFDPHSWPLPPSRSQPVEPVGQGLVNMRQRVEDLGGQLELKSDNGKGTRISIRIPQNRFTENRA